MGKVLNKDRIVFFVTNVFTPFKTESCTLFANKIFNSSGFLIAPPFIDAVLFNVDLKLYQTLYFCFNLTANGEIDHTTIEFMQVKRCGVEDDVLGLRTLTKWKDPKLKWH